MSMCVEGTPVEDHRAEYGLWVKREDLCCPSGPNFSKTRGVWTHVAARPERIIGVLDTSHSQGGWAVARACQLLNKQCVEFYPVRKADPHWFGQVQLQCRDLGSKVVPLQAGRSAVLYHAAKKRLEEHRLGTRGPSPCYMMPNALKLPEMITETAAEVRRTFDTVEMEEPDAPPDLSLRDKVNTILISASSATIAAGVCRGLLDLGWRGEVVVHQGYSRPQGAIREYMRKIAGVEAGTTTGIKVTLVDEGYSYADAARSGPIPPWPCNQYYDLKAFRWWVAKGRERHSEALLWNIG